MAYLDLTGLTLYDGKIKQYITDRTEILEYDVFREADATGSETWLPSTGQAGKIYVTRKTDSLYRWDGEKYVSVGGGGGGFAGASTTQDGAAGSVPAPSASSQDYNKFLCGDGTWATPQDTTYSSLAAASDGTALSLVTTGEKYVWNNIVTAARVKSALSTASDTTKYLNNAGSWAVPPDTKNTAGTTNKTGTKMFLACATEQATNPITYSNSNCYIGTDNCLYSGGVKVLTAHQSLANYALSANVVKLTGNETIAGTKTFSSAPVFLAAPATRTSTQYSNYLFQHLNNGTTATVAGIQVNKGSTTNITKSQITFYEYSPKTTAANTTTGYYEMYCLPECDKDRATTKGDYQILTNKNLVTVAQGGTGASTPAGARTALELGAAALKGVATSIAAGSTAVTLPTCAAVATFVEGKGYKTTDTDTKNTAGTSNKASTKLFLAGATSQASSATTYSNSACYIGTDNCLYSNSTKVLTAHQSLSTCVKTTSNWSLAGVISFTNTTASSSTTTGAVKISGGLGVAGEIYGAHVWNAVWNDYAECRQSYIDDPGCCITETQSGTMAKTWERLQPGCKIISDTFGTCMGKTDEAQTPIAVAGRVLAYPYRDISEYHLGDAVCSAPDGKIDIMTREEIREYPERIVGTVSEIPSYDVWYGGTKEDPKKIPVNGRIWIYVR